MGASFLPPKANAAFGSNPDDAVMHKNLVSANCHAAGLEAMVGAGLSWVDILQLIFNYGPLVTTVANELISALKSTGGLTLGIINQLIARYGPQVKQMIADLLAKLGIALPT